MRYPAMVLSALVMTASMSLAQTGFSTKTYPAVLASSSDNLKLLTSDLNGDGRPDLVSYGSRFNGSAPVNLFFNNGGGGFLSPVALPGSSTLVSVKIGDMNGDDYPDIVGCSTVGSGPTEAASVTVYLNTGNGSFKALPPVTGNGECNALTLGDVYRTGHLDVVTAGYTPGQYSPGGTFYPGNTNYVDVFSNNGTGSLTFRETSSGSTDDPSTSSTFTNCGIIDVVGADYQHDGSFELILTSDCQPKGQNLPGRAGTTFLALENITPSGPVYGTYNHVNSAYYDYLHGRAVDLTGVNMQPDVMYVGVQGGNYGDNLTYVQKVGSGAPTFTDLLDAMQVYGYAIGDFNADGFQDVATSYTQASSASPASPMIAILAGTQNHTFTQSQSFATGTTSELGGDVASADFNGDGKPDMATLVYDTNTRTTSLNVYTNTQSGSSNACSTPTKTNTNTICSPVSGATLNSPVTVSAASNVTGFTLNRVYLDNTSVYQTTSQTVSTSINAGSGRHYLVLVSYNNQAQAFTSTVSFTVGNATGGGCIPSTPGVSICSPANGSTDSPPVTIAAGAMAQSGYITAMRVYVDNNAEFTVNNPSQSKTFSINQGGLDYGGGTHHLVVVGYQSTGGAVTGSAYFTEPGGPCTPTSSPGTQIRICSPIPNVTLTSPATVSAGASPGSGYITGIRAYIDNNPVAFYSNTQKSIPFYVNQQLAFPSGTHYFVMVAYTSTGISTSAAEYLTFK